MSKKTGHALKDFRDAGTGERFAGGKSHEFDAGAYRNYLAAGLIRGVEAKSDTGGKSKAA